MIYGTPLSRQAPRAPAPVSRRGSRLLLAGLEAVWPFGAFLAGFGAVLARFGAGFRRISPGLVAAEAAGGGLSEDDHVCAYMKGFLRCGTSRACTRWRSTPGSRRPRCRGCWPGTSASCPAPGQGAHRGRRAGLRAERRGPGPGRAADRRARAVLPDLDSDEGDAAYWYDEVIRGMERAARRGGYAMLIAASHRRDDSGLVLSIAGRCDGLVVLARTAPLAMIEHVATRIPVVLLATGEGGGRPDRAIDNLAVANETGAFQVTGHLADMHGYPDLCFIAGPPDSPDSSSRLMASAGRPPGSTSRPSTTATSPPRAAGGSRSGSSPPGTYPRPGVRQRPDRDRGDGGAAAGGLSVPGDVAVTGFDGIRLGGTCGRASPPWSSRWRRSAIPPWPCSAIASGAELPRRTVELPVRLELGGSCGCSEKPLKPSRRNGCAVFDEAGSGDPGGASRSWSRSPWPRCWPRDRPGGLRVAGQPVRRAQHGPAGQPDGHRAGHLEVLRPDVDQATSLPMDNITFAGGSATPTGRTVPPRRTSACTCGRGLGPGSRLDQRGAGRRQAFRHPHRGVGPEAVRWLPVPVDETTSGAGPTNPGQGDCTETTRCSTTASSSPTWTTAGTPWA